MKYVCKEGHKFVHTAKVTSTVNADVLEFNVCPFCRTIEYDEVGDKDYADWKQVSHSAVKGFLDEGWQVLSHTKDNVVIGKAK